MGGIVGRGGGGRERERKANATGAEDKRGRGRGGTGVENTYTHTLCSRGAERGCLSREATTIEQSPSTTRPYLSTYAWKYGNTMPALSRTLVTEECKQSLKSP